MKRIRTKFDTANCGLDAKTQAVFQNEIDDVLSFQRHIRAVQSELERFESELQTAYEKNEFLDTSLAKKLISASYFLVQHIEKDPWQDATPFVLAAIRYLVRSNDSKKDFQSIDGFEDDLQVLKAVISKFNLQSVCSI